MQSPSHDALMFAYVENISQPGRIDGDLPVNRKEGK